jgi:hypothetical protein
LDFIPTWALTGEALGRNAEELRRSGELAEEAGVRMETAWRSAPGRNGFVFPYQGVNAKNADSNSKKREIKARGRGWGKTENNLGRNMLRLQRVDENAVCNNSAAPIAWLWRRCASIFR